MIHIEIIKSHNLDAIGNYKYFYNEITLGNSSTNNIILNDSIIADKKMTFKVSGEKILISASSFISNGKKVSGTKIHHKDSIISFGQTEIKIVDFSLNEKDLNLLYTEKVKESPNLEELIFELKNELIRLEREENV